VKTKTNNPLKNQIFKFIENKTRDHPPKETSVTYKMLWISDLTKNTTIICLGAFSSDVYITLKKTILRPANNIDT
jgi:hypothetical protein